MKREIKFRAWREWDRRMVYDDICVCLSFQDDGVVDQCSSVAMQFTGLQDKNGKEIYEGDIIEIPCLRYGLPSVYLQTVEWSTCDDGYVETTGYDSTYFHKSHVIGNIYEHPELLQR